MTPDPQSPQVPPLPDRFEAVEPLADTPFEQSLRAYDRVLERVFVPLVVQVPWQAPQTP